MQGSAWPQLISIVFVYVNISILPLLLTRSVSPTSDYQLRLVDCSYPLSILDASLIFPHLGLERGQVVISDTPIEDLISRCLEKARAINTLKKEVGMKCNLCMMQRLENGKKRPPPNVGAAIANELMDTTV